jgi:hypothetical protein
MHRLVSDAFRPWSAENRRRTIAVVLGIAAFIAFVAFVYGPSQRHAADAGLVQDYCRIGAVSHAQERGCERHVTARDVDRRAQQGDQTAVEAENDEDAAAQAQQESSGN